MNRAQAFKVMLPFIAVSFSQASGKFLRRGRIQRSMRRSHPKPMRGPSVRRASTLKETPATKCKCRSTRSG